ncbi:MAG: hypothetical protein U5K51_00765 [Flavobacteriaceae bacterium]|nr:hypothetical protein [Flavobacteriaceae bacterium]
MKYVLKLILGIFILSNLFIGCSDDDDDDKAKNNELKVEDQVYGLNSGMLINVGQADDEITQYKGYMQVVALVSEEIDLINETGVGQLILFQLFSSSANTLDTGDYTFDATPPLNVKTFGGGGYTLNFDASADEIEDDDLVAITSGTISVTKNGNSYEISAKCKDLNGKNVTAYYKGLLIYVDLTAGFKPAPVFTKILN